MARVEIYVITKEGMLIHKYSLLEMDESTRDQLVGGFLTALNSFAQEIGFPQGVSLIRSGNLEARFSSGNYIFSVLMIDYSIPLGLMTEPILSSLTNEITELFEKKFIAQLQHGKELNMYRSSDFHDFRVEIDRLIDRYGDETFELYQKLVLIEALYAKIPQKYILPLMEKTSQHEDICEDLKTIPQAYQWSLQKVIEKVNFESAPLWQIFATSLFHP